MAKITLSRNLKLKISSDLTADSKYNLDRIDLLAGNLLPQTAGDITLRSAGAITLEPNSSDLNGSGVGGAINFGSADKPLDSLSIYSSSLKLSASGLSLGDSAAGGAKYLNLVYKSDLEAPGPDTLANRTLFLSPLGEDRNLILGANFSLLGPGSLELLSASDLSLVLPPDYGSLGQVLVTDGTGVLSWESASAASLDGLSDVVLDSPQGGDTLRFNSGTQKWENGQAGFTGVWANSDGASRAFTHNLGTRNVIVHILDESYKLIEVDSVESTTNSYVTITASEAPQSSWTVLISPI